MPLFRDDTLKHWLETLDESLAESIRRLAQFNEGDLLARAPNDLAEECVKAFAIEMPRLMTPIQVTSPAKPTEVTVRIPVEGESAMLVCTPDRPLAHRPSGEYSDAGRHITMTRDFPNMDPAEVRAWVDEQVALIRKWLDRIATQVGPWNESLHARATEQIATRRQEAEKRREFVKGIGYPEARDKR